MKFRPLFLSMLMLSTPALAADNLTIGVDQRQSLGVTLYNQDLALVRETRELPAMQSGQKVIIEDVSKQLQPETLRIKNAGAILEQNFNARLLSQHALLEHYINKELELARINPATGAETISKATLLSVNGNQALVSRNNRVESIPLNSHWRFIFPSRPAALLTKPNLSFRSQGTGSARDARISYLTGGLNWTMNYVLTLSQDGDNANLSGMASLTNNSGTGYPNASIQLMAGNVNTAPPQPRYKAQREMAVVALGAAADSVAPPAQMEAFHLYQLPGKVNLEDGQQKQITLLSSDDVSLKRTYQHEFYVAANQDAQRYRIKPNLRLSFNNTNEEGLGQPMPAGNIRVFRPDSQEQLQFVGGARINHTAEKDPVKITLGQAFDVTVQRHQSQFQKTYNGFLVGQAIRITNSRNKPATVVLRANFPYEWQLEHSSLPMEKINAGAAQWTVEVAGKSDQVLNFSVQMKKPDRK
ncbi:DUF4139 domain-containing protein [Pontibacterium sp.]|uniref:DUF4139 domain-containing protein n=2 Tax=Pontibacterium sp. TaxID=2036026 RepID=UPI0035118DF8